MSELVRPDVMLAIGVMTAVTVALRFGGYFLMGYVPLTPRVRRMLNALPGSIIAAAVLPVMIQGGLVATLAVVAALIVMALTRNDFGAVVVGVVIAALARFAGLG